jgi:ABC-type phosphate transport system substrate-binding protein
MAMRAREKAIMTVLLAMGVSNGVQPAAVTGPLLVVANADTPALDADTLQKIYLGKVVEVGGRPVVPVNLAKGNSLRTAFMEQVLAQDDDKFIAYWTVRRYIGKGSPPREFATTQEQLEFLRKTPGAVGYVSDAGQIEQGLKTILKKP